MTTTRWLQQIRVQPAPARLGEINYSPIDRFTCVHFAIGMLYGYLGLGAGSVVLLAVVWELIENPLKVHARFLFPHPTADSLRNMVSDGLAVTIGWATFLWSAWL